MSDTNFQLPVWAENSQRGLIIHIRLQPGARTTRVIGEHGEELKVAIMSPPVDGKANAALLKWFADTLKLPKSAVQLVSGQTSRSKKISLGQLQKSQIQDVIRQLVPTAS